MPDSHPARGTITTMAIDMPPERALLRLLAWLSPSFPTGGYAYSHGLEWTVEQGDVRDLAGLLDWIEVVLRHGSGWTDTILLRHAWRAEGAESLREIADLAAALAVSRERFEETVDQGASFARAVSVWGVLPPVIATQDEAPWPLPVVIGSSFRVAGLAEDQAAFGALHGFVANLVSAAVRLVPLGQTDGLRALRALEAVIEQVGDLTRSATLDEVGGFAFGAELASFRHETQSTRLFRT